MTKWARVGTRERGAALVEFALVMPFLILLLIGIVEFSWVFAQNLDVRHGAREAARLAAVNYPVGPTNPSPTDRLSSQTDEIVAEVCSRMDLTTGVTVSLLSPGTVNSGITATVEAPISTLTGFLDWALPPTLVLSSTVETRVEQPAGWADTTDQGCP